MLDDAITIELFIKFWKLLSDNAFFGALIASILSWIVIYYATEKISARNKIKALKKELIMNVKSIENTLQNALVSGKINPFFNLHNDAYTQFKNSMISKKINKDIADEVDIIYDEIGIIKSASFSIQLGLRGCAKPEEIKNGWEILISKIKNIQGKL